MSGLNARWLLLLWKSLVGFLLHLRPLLWLYILRLPGLRLNQCLSESSRRLGLVGLILILWKSGSLKRLLLSSAWCNRLSITDRLRTLLHKTQTVLLWGVWGDLRLGLLRLYWLILFLLNRLQRFELVQRWLQLSFYIFILLFFLFQLLF